MLKKSIRILSVIFVLCIVSCFSNHDVKIACIGDSITEGAGLAKQSKSSYPVILDELLGEGFEVLNCGQSAATMLKESDYSYWNSNEFSNVFAFNPDLVVIALGTNDSKDFNWNANRFAQDYQSMINLLKSSNPAMKIFICLPLPALSHSWGIDDSTIFNGVTPILKKMAIENNLHLIDLYTPFRLHPEVLPDSIHPNEAGTKMMAEIIEKEIQKQ